MPDTITIPAIVEMSDLVAVMGYNFLTRHMRHHALALLGTPIKIPPIRGALVWSKSADDDMGHKWLRERIEQILRAPLSLNDRR